MRLIVTVLSMGTIAAYGYALAGLGGFFFGKGSLHYIIWGLIGGTICGAAAIILWRKNITEFYVQDSPEEDLQNLEVKFPEEKKDE